MCIGFGGFLRRSEIHELDVCDVRRETDKTIVNIKRAKMDQVGRGRSTIIGAAVGGAAAAEQTIWSLYANCQSLLPQEPYSQYWSTRAALLLRFALPSATPPESMPVAPAPAGPRPDHLIRPLGEGCVMGGD
eukprot:COSAG01_NODE_2294_length_7967_cov_41.570539_2_plen_132_part_00